MKKNPLADHLCYDKSKFHAFTEISNLVRGSNVHRIERSFATSCASAKPVREGRKRLPSDERKAMVESFVNKYRAMNMGKFPTPSNAQKEVGGSYYSIRKILQELEFKSKMSSINTRISPGKELAEENESPTEGEVVASSQMTLEPQTETEEVSSSHLMDARLHKDALPVPVNVLDTYDSRKHFKCKVGTEISNSAENVNSEGVAKPKATGDEEKTISEDVDFDSPKLKAEQHEQAELDNFTRDSPDSQIDAERGNKPFFWRNLKSLADGIISVWRKL